MQEENQRKQEREKIRIMNKKTTKMLLIIILLLTILVIILLIMQYTPDILKPQEPRLFVIKDECSLILNNIIHQIKNEDECRITCRNNCNLRKMDFHNSEFVEKEDSCHICNCYCK